jgi:hypothetical protein
MKKIFLGLFIASIAFISSAFKNKEKHFENANLKFYVERYLVQVSQGGWIHMMPSDIDDGTCGVPTSWPCIFLITSEIPTQGSYNVTEVLSTYASNLDNMEPDSDYLYEVPE